MRLLRIAATAALLLFVGATVGLLIAQEASQPRAAGVSQGDENTLRMDEAGSPATLADSASDAPDTAATDSPLAREDTGSGESSPGEPQAAGDTATASHEGEPSSPCVVDAIYFHNTSRCHTCLEIEALARAVLETEFASQVTEGRLRWSAIDMQSNRRYIEQYDLAMPTLILLRSEDGHPEDWVPLNETWTLIRNESRFTTYIVDSTRAFLEGCP